MTGFLFISLFAAGVRAGEPSAIEDSNFAPESGWNRSDAVLQYNSFYLRDAASYELVGEWPGSSPRHQFSYTLPLYSDRTVGIGDAMLNYRYQLHGHTDSRFAAASRVSLVLPTRSAKFGERSSGIQMNVPMSVTVGSRMITTTSIGASWYREREHREVNVAQSVTVALAGGGSLSLDAAYTRANHDSRMLVVRPAIQFVIDAPGGLQLSPGVAFPRGGGSEGVMLFMSVEHRLRSR